MQYVLQGKGEKVGQKEAKNCWEYWDCLELIKKRCRVYAVGAGDNCWIVAGKIAFDPEKSISNKKYYDNCSVCPWFKKRVSLQ